MFTMDDFIVIGYHDFQLKRIWKVFEKKCTFQYLITFYKSIYKKK